MRSAKLAMASSRSSPCRTGHSLRLTAGALDSGYSSITVAGKLISRVFSPHGWSRTTRTLLAAVVRARGAQKRRPSKGGQLQPLEDDFHTSGDLPAPEAEVQALRAVTDAISGALGNLGSSRDEAKDAFYDRTRARV